MGREPAADFQIFDARGEMIWSRLRGEIMLGALRLYPLDAGKELVFREVWDGQGDNGRPAGPGEYTIRGVLLTDDPGGLASVPTAIRIER
jgi:Intracellular proteinase inhibitor